MKKRLLIAAMVALALSACSSKSTPSVATRPGNVRVPGPTGAAPLHTHIVNPPILAANLGVPASALLSAGGMQQIAAGVAVQLQGVVLDVSLTTYGQFLASVHHSHRSGYVDSNRQVWRVTYGLSNGRTIGGGVIAPGGRKLSIYDAVDGRYLGSTYQGTYLTVFSVRRHPHSIR